MVQPSVSIFFHYFAVLLCRFSELSQTLLQHRNLGFFQFLFKCFYYFVLSKFLYHVNHLNIITRLDRSDKLLSFTYIRADYLPKTYVETILRMFSPSNHSGNSSSRLSGIEFVGSAPSSYDNSSSSIIPAQRSP